MHNCTLQRQKDKGVFSTRITLSKKREINGQNLIIKYFWGSNVKEVSNRKEWPESSVLPKANLRQDSVRGVSDLEEDRGELSCVKSRLIGFHFFRSDYVVCL